MKRIQLAVIALFTLVTVNNVSAQDSNNPWAVTIGVNAVDVRSTGDFSVKQFSRNHFNGGGHDNAAGGKFSGSVEEVITTFKELLPTYKNELNRSYEI